MSPERTTPSRRRFLRNLTAGLALPAAAGAWASVGETYWPEFTRVPMPVPNLPPSFDQMRIAHLSDLHICSPARLALARAVVEHVNALRPDLALVTGDLVTQSRGWIREACDA